MSRLRDGQPVEVSVGAWVTLEDASGTAGGRRFGLRWVHVSADHLAMLPEGQPGACSITDGCGAGRTSFMAAQARPTVEDVLEAIHRTQFARESARIRRAAELAPPPNPYDLALERRRNRR